MIYHPIPQRSEEWYTLRLGIPTASEFHKLLTPKTRKLSASHAYVLYRLLAEQITGERVENAETDWMTRGVELEDKAIATYESLTDTETLPGGFITDDNRTMGCSPDRLIGTDGGLEIKCRLIHTQIEQALTGTAAEEAMAQIQGCLLISEREWWDVFNYHPRLLIPPIRTYRNEEFIGDLKGVLTNFRSIMIEKRAELDAKFGPFVIPEREEAGHSADFISDADVEAIIAATRSADV